MMTCQSRSSSRGWEVFGPLLFCISNFGQLLARCTDRVLNKFSLARKGSLALAHTLGKSRLPYNRHDKSSFELEAEPPGHNWHIKGQVCQCQWRVQVEVASLTGCQCLALAAACQ